MEVTASSRHFDGRRRSRRVSDHADRNASVRRAGLERSRCRNGPALATFGAGRSWGETLKFATCAKARADQRPTSPPSRAGILMWRAAGLLRRLRCGPVRAADAPPGTRPLTVSMATVVQVPEPRGPDETVVVLGGDRVVPLGNRSLGPACGAGTSQRRDDDPGELLERQVFSSRVGQKLRHDASEVRRDRTTRGVQVAGHRAASPRAPGLFSASPQSWESVVARRWRIIPSGIRATGRGSGVSRYSPWWRGVAMMHTGSRGRGDRKPGRSRCTAALPTTVGVEPGSVPASRPRPSDASGVGACGQAPSPEAGRASGRPHWHSHSFRVITSAHSGSSSTDPCRSDPQSLIAKDSSLGENLILPLTRHLSGLSPLLTILWPTRNHGSERRYARQIDV